MKQTFGLLVGASLFLCAVSNTHADTLKLIGASSMQLTSSETTSVFFDANSQARAPSNPTTSAMIVPVADEPLFNADRQDEPTASVPSQAAANSPPDNVLAAMPANGGNSSAVLVLAALGIAPQLQESGPFAQQR